MELALKILVVAVIAIAAALECAKSRASLNGEWKVLRVCYALRATVASVATWMTFLGTQTEGGNRIALLTVLAVPMWLLVLVLHIHAIRFSESGISVKRITTRGRWRNFAWTDVREIEIDPAYLVFRFMDGKDLSVCRFTFRGGRDLTAFCLNMVERG